MLEEKLLMLVHVYDGGSTAYPFLHREGFADTDALIEKHNITYEEDSGVETLEVADVELYYLSPEERRRIAALISPEEDQPAETPKTRYFLIVHKIPSVLQSPHYMIQTDGEWPTVEIVNRKLLRLPPDKVIPARGDELVIQEVSPEFWSSVRGFSWQRE